MANVTLMLSDLFCFMSEASPYCFRIFPLLFWVTISLTVVSQIPLKFPIYNSLMGNSAPIQGMGKWSIILASQYRTFFGNRIGKFPRNEVGQGLQSSWPPPLARLPRSLGWSLCSQRGLPFKVSELSANDTYLTFGLHIFLLKTYFRGIYLAFLNPSRLKR